MEKILLPTDFSSNAWNAIRYAIELYSEKACNFYLLNTYTPVIVHSRFMAASVHEGLPEDNERRFSESGLKEVLEQIELECKYPGHHFETVSSFSLLTDKINDMVDSHQIDLIITGTKGASGISEIFLGSNTVRMIKAARHCPVLVIPEGFSFKKPGRIAFATDFRRSFSLDILQPLLSLTKIFDANVDIIHINENEELDRYQQANMELLDEYFKDTPHEYHWLPYFTGKSDVLQYFLKEFDVDMLALVHYRHGFLEELIREPVVKRVAFHTKLPLLVIPE